ncbi:MAG: DNA internalization-related competence protein ComEC/Rec2 [Lachnospiraceae bacterium]|nr:DNA internalization-related competence protein ComEC/Rec2 [Lachnospiraceae bacterium]
MKRPMFWAVIYFALGEVVYVCVKTVVLTGIIMIMLICCAWLCINTGRIKRIKLCAVLFIFMLLGYVNTAVRDYDRRYDIDGIDGCYIKVDATVYKIDTGSEGVNLYLKTDNALNVIVFNQEDKFRLGDRVNIKGTLNAFEQNSNAGCFDFKRFYKSRNISLSVKNCEIEILSHNDGLYYDYLNFLLGLKKDIKYKLRIITGAEEGTDKAPEDGSDVEIFGIYSGILLGDRKDIDDITLLDYRNSGIAHILAISGLHISLLFTICFGLLKKIGINRYAAGGASFIIIFSYAIMSGLSMSTLRALIMIVISMIAIYTGETYDMPISLAVALIIILLYQPFRIYDGSVILSVTAVFGVCVGNHLIRYVKRTRFYRQGKTFKKRIVFTLINSFIISISVNLIMFPVMIYTYHEITPYGFLLNLIVIPLMTVVVLSGAVAIIVSYIYIPAASYIILIGKVVLKFYDVICDVTYKLPFNTINIGHIRLYQVLIYYLWIIGFLVLFNKKLTRKIRERIYHITHVWLTHKGWLRLCVSTVIVVSAFVWIFLGFTYVKSLDEIVICADVGQGDGIFIRTDSGMNIAIDGGSTSEEKLGQYTISPMLKYYGMAHIDYWFISHTDMDHISSLLYILSMGRRSGITIDNIVLSSHMRGEENCENLIELAEICGVNILYMKAGDYLYDDTYRITCAHPDDIYVTEDINDYSLCLSYVSDDFTVLFTGDMGNNSIEYMLGNEREYLYDAYGIIKVPHHGSKNSADKMLYENIKIYYAVISCGKNNRYGHPHDETIKLLEKYGIKIYRTDEDGGIVFRETAPGDGGWGLK